jgi:hypothetical protein
MCSSIVFELVEEKKDRKNKKVFCSLLNSTKTHVYFDMIIAATGLKVNLFPTVKSLSAAP